MAPIETGKESIGTPDQVARLVDHILGLKTTYGGALTLDLEGDNLGMAGMVTLAQIKIVQYESVYLADVQTLQKATLDARGTCGKTPGDIPQSRIGIIGYDLCSDVNALKQHFDMTLDCGITDGHRESWSRPPPTSKSGILPIATSSSQTAKAHTESAAWKPVPANGPTLTDPKSSPLSQYREQRRPESWPKLPMERTSLQSVH